MDPKKKAMFYETACAGSILLASLCSDTKASILLGLLGLCAAIIAHAYLLSSPRP